MSNPNQVPDLPDWIIEGMRLTEEREVLQARARAAWRRHAAQDAVKYCKAATESAVALNPLYKRLESLRQAARQFERHRDTSQ